MNLIPKSFVQKNSIWKRDILLPFLKPGEKVLDFGCGDLTLAKSLYKKIPSLKLTGIDVVDFKNTHKNINFRVYNGKKLPFKDNTFDTVIAFYVLHHCDSAEKSFLECARVARKKVILVESLPRSRFEIPLMKFIDFITNKAKFENISLPYEFYSMKKWNKIFKENKIKSAEIIPFGNKILRNFPIGGQYIIIAKKV